MIAKTFLSLALISITASMVNAQVCNNFKDKKIFVCDGDDQQLVTIYGAALQCKTGEICNSNYDEVDDAGTKYCNPCVTADSVCKNVFECVPSTNSFKMGQSIIDCPKGQICNNERKESCKPCIIQRCDKTSWTCDPTDKTIVKVGTMEGKCTGTSVCNDQYVAPCNACIDPTGTSSAPTTTTTAVSTPIPTTTTVPPTTTTTTPTTTTTNVPSTPPPTSTTTTTQLSTISSQPTTPSTTQSSSTGTTTSSTTIAPTTPTTTTTTNATTTTTTARPTTTTIPPFKVPDCNDGHGDTKPCRPGPNGASYYYKCKYYSPAWYDYEIKYCRDVNYDPKCLGIVCLN